MIAKIFEIVDLMTFIPVLAVQLGSQHEAERYLASTLGFGRRVDQQAKYVLLAKINGGCGPMCCDVYDWWPSRTLQTAHQYIIEHFDDLEPGAVVDVEFILGETTAPKQSQRIEDQQQGDPSDWDANLGSRTR